MRLTVRLLGFAAAFVAVLAMASLASAHGTNILVTQVNNKLVVSGGTPDSAGYAPMIFVEDDTDGIYFTEATLSGFGYSTIWQIPGFHITGLDEGSGLFLDPLIRPFAHATPVENRALWYANPATARVLDAPSDHPLQIRKSPTVAVTLLPEGGSDPLPIQIAVPNASEMVPDKHLVAYGLRYDEEDSIEPPAGAYGFFVRLTSNLYAPSEPFLIVLNNRIDAYTSMVPAALEINASAFLPGDYNHNERVDAADYVIWRKTFGSTTSLAADGSYNRLVDQADFNFWRQNFGAVVSGSGSGVSYSSVPEPDGWVAAVSGIIGFFACKNRARTTPRKSLPRT